MRWRKLFARIASSTSVTARGLGNGYEGLDGLRRVGKAGGGRGGTGMECRVKDGKMQRDARRNVMECI